MRFPEFSGEWEKVLLSSACEINPKTGPLDNQFLYIDLESVVKGSLVKRQIIEKDGAPSRAQRVLKENDILYQCVRPYQLNNYIFEGDTIQCVASTGYAQLRTTQFPLYIFQALHTKQFTNQVLERCTGTNYPAINSSDLGTVEVPVCSLPEQVKIGSLLALIDSRIKTQSKIIEDKEALYKAISSRLFLLYTNCSPTNKLGDIAKIYQPETIPSTKLSCDGLYLVYGANGVIGRYDKYNHENSQICLTCRGNTCGNINFSQPYSWITGNAMVINIDSNTDNIDKRFLYHYLHNYNFSPFISGSGQPQIVRSTVEKLPVPNVNIQTQKKIASILDCIVMSIDIARKKVDMDQNIKKYLLENLFI